MEETKDASSWVLPIRISVDRWRISLPERDRDLLEYALCNAADELIRQPLPGATLRVRRGAAVFLFGLPSRNPILSGVENRCKMLRRVARTHLYAEVEVEIGDSVAMRELPRDDPPDDEPKPGRRPTIEPRARLANDAPLRQILDYIEKRLPEPPTREEIAHFVHFHPAYLSRFFRKKTGWSLSEYIARQRIEYAKELLTQSELQVTHIMSRLGYDNLSHFTRTFKKLTGYTPMQYRKKIH
ncbi:helix-turn-helix transcriptional regulator [Paenibacillaceae bacterium WGS1546]|uniref:helix-turn-helix transcriptional regulator n=1 Tax=Cohnella sp. WGS1546 TaxID=3366810 RepID=UPI00372CEF69